MVSVRLLFYLGDIPSFYAGHIFDIGLRDGVITWQVYLGATPSQSSVGRPSSIFAPGVEGIRSPAGPRDQEAGREAPPIGTEKK